MERCSLRQGWRRPLAFGVLVVLGGLWTCGLPAAAQESGGTLAGALAAIDQGHLEEAIGLLEVRQEGGVATPRELATLGALYLEVGLPGDALITLAGLAEAGGADAAVLYNAGRAALALGQLERAAGFLERSVRLVPDSPASRELGLLAGRLGELPQAFGLLGGWVEDHPDDSDARLAAAAAAVKLGRLSEAATLLGPVAPGEPRAALLRAQLALAEGRADEAAALLEPFRAAPPAEMATDLVALLADAYLASGRSADALTLLRDDQLPSAPRLILALAKALYQSGDAAAAETTLRPLATPLLAGQLPPANSPAAALAAAVLLELGRARLTGEDPAGAQSALEVAARLDPWEVAVWQELARARALTGDDQGAAAAVARIEELEAAKQRAAVAGMAGVRRLTDTTGRQLGEAMEWLERGEGERALELLRDEISLAPEDLRPRLAEIRTLVVLGRSDDALAAAERTLQQFRGQPDGVYFRGVARWSAGDVAGAEADFRQTIAIAAGHLPARIDLARLLAARGARQEARQLLQQALQLSPGNELASRGLALLGGPD